MRSLSMSRGENEFMQSACHVASMFLNGLDTKLQQNDEEMHTLRKDKESALALVEEGFRRRYLTNNSVENFEYCSEINFTGVIWTKIN